jgi:hypothetical protein
LFYVPQANVATVAVSVGTQPSVTFSTPIEIQSVRSPLVSTDVRGYDVLPDGRFISVVPESEPGESAALAAREVRIVLNWFEELKRLVPKN